MKYIQLFTHRPNKLNLNTKFIISIDLQITNKLYIALIQLYIFYQFSLFICERFNPSFFISFSNNMLSKFSFDITSRSLIQFSSDCGDFITSFTKSTSALSENLRLLIFPPMDDAIMSVFVSTVSVV